MYKFPMSLKKIIGITVAVIVVGLGIYGLTHQQPLAEPTISSTPMSNEELKIETIVEGSGMGAKAGDSLSVLYKGMLTDGRVFDASDLHGNQAFTLTLGAGMVIAGWDQGLIGIKVGEKRRLTIPSSLGYGSRGAPGSIIGADADLIFEVELIKLVPKQ